MANESLITADTRPSDLVYALMSQHVYEEEKLKKWNKLPGYEDWQVLRTQKGTSDYFGVIYVNTTTKQLVVAHKENYSIGAVIEGIRNIVLNSESPHKQEVFALTQKAIDYTKEGPYKGYHLSFTGHLLGGFLAELCVFYCPRSFDYQAHVNAVTFESPGMLQSLHQLDSHLEPVNLDLLDIVGYVSSPNLINTFNNHIGTLYTFEAHLSQWVDWSDCWYTYKAHTIDTMVECLRNENKYTLSYLTDWPMGSQRDIFFDETKGKDGKYQLERYEAFVEANKQQFKLDFKGHHHIDAELSNRISLPLKHFPPPLHAFLKAFHACLLNSGKEEGFRARLLEQWKLASIPDYITGYLLGGYHIEVRQSGLEVLRLDLSQILELATVTVAQVREEISTWLSQSGQSIPELLGLCNPSLPKPALSIMAAVIGTGATLADGTKVTDNTIRLLENYLPASPSERGVAAAKTILSQIQASISSITAYIIAPGVNLPPGTNVIGNTASVTINAPIVLPPEKQPISDWQVPEDNAKHFIQRDDFYKPLTDYFKDNTEQRTIVVNAGLGGVGKTELAIYYAHHAEKAYPLKCWFKASTRDGLFAEYREFCNSQHIMPPEPTPTAIIQAVRNWFSDSHSPRWLIVYDDAVDQPMLQEFLPSKGGDIIITSRHQHWSYSKLSITIMTESEALALLKKSIDPENKLTFTERDDTDLKKLAEKLGQLPLALAQAGAYIHAANGRISIINYLALFEKHQVKLLADKKLPAGQNHEPITVTWHITLTAMQEKCSNTIKLLEALSFLDSSRIPNFLLEAWAKQGEQPWDELELEEALRTAIDYSMVQQSGNGNEATFAMHNLVQLVIRSGLTDDYQRTCLMQWITCINQLHKEVDEVKPLLIEQREDQLLAHSNRILDYIKNEYFFDTKPEKALFYFNISSIYSKLGHSQKSKELLEEALGIQVAHYGRAHWKTAPILGNLATAYSNLGDEQKNKELLEETLDIFVTHFGRGHWQTASILHNLAANYGTLGDNKKQKELSEETLVVKVAYYGRGHEKTASTLIVLAAAHGGLGDHKKEKELLEEALGIQVAYYGREHWQTASTLHNLANAYGDLGDDKKKKELLKEVLSIQIAHYGQGHWQTAITLVNLANAYGTLRDNKKSKELLEQALDIEIAHYGRGHWQIASTLGNLAIVYGDLGDNQKQKELLKEVLGIFVTQYGREHWQTAIVLQNLAIAYGALENHKKKKDLLEEALGIQVAHYGRDHWQTARTLGNLANAYGDLGDNQKKKDLLEEVLVIQTAHYGRNHWQTARTLGNLANAYGELGDNQKQKDLLEEALGIQTAHYGRGHYEVGKTAFNLALAHFKLDELKLVYETMVYAYQCLLNHPSHPNYPPVQQAEWWLTNIKQRMASQIEPHNSSASKLIQPRLFKPSSTIKINMSSAERQLLLGQLAQKNTEAVRHYKDTDFIQALVLWQNALEIARRIPKEKHPNFHDELAVLHSNIGTAHKHLGHHEEAIRFFKQSIALREEKYGLNCQEAQKSRDKLAEVEHLLFVSKNNCNPVINASPRFFASADKPSSIKPREGLKNEEKLAKVLEQHLRGGLTFGKAHAQGDCFFDALAQCLNQINNTDVNTDKTLRMLCHDYYGKNKGLVDKLNLKDYGGIDKQDDYSMVQYTVEECEMHFHGRSPIWGRPYVEGIMLCNQLNLRGLCVIEILEHPETKEPIPSFHWVNQESYTSINEQEAKERLSNLEIPTLIVEQNSLHFVPLLSTSAANLEPSNELLSAVMI